VIHTPDPLGPANPPALDPAIVREAVRRFLAEDVGPGDLTSALVVPRDATARGHIVARQACVIAGQALACEVFAQLDQSVSYSTLVADGEFVPAGTACASVQGPAEPILTGERTALNLLQRLSGVATVTRRYVDTIAGTNACVSDTRKTTPGLRTLEKYAVRVGGGRNHRIGLFDAVLIKDNHLVVAGGVDHALAAASAVPATIAVQVEVDSLEQLRVALACGVKAVLLDNMPPAMIADAVRLVRAAAGGESCWIEASGGITLANVRAYADAGVDTISVGALTHSAPAVDLALDFEHLGT
jgi:nicotinate-nucleotide pyrophosphorylase (carboxylating)